MFFRSNFEIKSRFYIFFFEIIVRLIPVDKNRETKERKFQVIQLINKLHNTHI